MDSDADEITGDLTDQLPDGTVDKLVDKVLRLNKSQKIKKPSRTEAALQISEFDLVKTAADKANIQLNQLTRPLVRKRDHTKISKSLKKVKKSKLLLKPLEKPQAERIRRSIGYEKTRLELDRWEPIITSNRVSTNLKFPLITDTKLNNNEREQLVNRFRLRSDLQKELDKIETYHISTPTITTTDDKDVTKVTMEEILEHRKEVAKLRAYQSYREAKARRQNKIKSKKYHRIQKKERIKQQLKEFEQLQKIDPEAALKKLEEIEKARIEERFSLRHKSTGQWARNQQVRAKYDKESRQVLAQQLSISKELTQKTKIVDSDSDIGEQDKDVEMDLGNTDSDNPWVNGIKPGQEVADFVNGYRKFWNEHNQQLTEGNRDETAGINGNQVDDRSGETTEDGKINEIVENSEETPQKSDGGTVESKKVVKKKKQVGDKTKTIKKKKRTPPPPTSDSDGEQIDEMFDKLENKLEKRMLQNYEKLKKTTKKTKTTNNSNKIEKKKVKVDLSMPVQKKRPIIDEEMHEDTNITPEETHSNEINKLKTLLQKEPKKQAQQQPQVDPNKFITTKITNLPNELPDIQITDDNEELTTNQQHDLMLEAFQDHDDLINDFHKEKTDEIDKDKPKDINLTLPGWGEWGGQNIQPNQRKQRRFTIKAPPKIKRKDDNKGNLIINENAQKKIKQHLVNEVPFPFKTVRDFEASIRAPISQTFVPETAFKRLIKPDVITKMGKIIEPMSKDVLLKRK